MWPPLFRGKLLVAARFPLLPALARVGRRVVLVPTMLPTPAEYEPLADSNIRELGWSQLTLFSRLKPSARNCRFMRSVILVFLTSPKSTFDRPGPIRMFRPALPSVNCR